MRLTSLLLATFFSALGLGYIKFFALGHISTVHYTAEDKAWIIQTIGAIMTIGPFLAYFIAAPIVSSYKKRWAMTAGAGGGALLLLIGYYTGWAGSVWLYLFLIGSVIAVFAAGKMSSIPLEAKESSRSTCLVNGLTTALFILGMLLGIPLGTHFYDNAEAQTGVYLGISFFIAAGIFSVPLNFRSENLEPFSKSRRLLINDSVSIFFRYCLYLLSAPVVWGIGAAISLAVTAYAEAHGIGDAFKCSFMSLYAAIGIIVGSIVSTKLQRVRYTAASVCAVLLCIFIAALPMWVEGAMQVVDSPESLYIPLALHMVILGLCFGILTNLIDAEYLKKVEEEKKEGTGAALHSAAISFFSCVIGAFVGFSIVFGWLNSVTQFVLLAVLCLLSVIPVLCLAFRHGSLDRMLTCFFSKATARVLKLRYRVKVTGQKISADGKGILFLPNHPAEMDPIILGSLLWNEHRPRPVATEKFYHMPVVNKLMELMHALPMPDMSTGTGMHKKRRIDDTLNAVSGGLASGDAVVMYPSGMLMRSSREVLGGASGVFRILEKIQGLRIVMVRTRGLWGSSFSTALTDGKTPELKTVFLHGLKVLLKNFIFFTPRRNIEVELKEISPSELLDKSALEINRYLESYYNEHGDEPLTRTSYSAFSEKHLDVKVKDARSSGDLSAVPQERVDEIRKSFAKAFKLEMGQVESGSRLADDLGMDSLAKAELLIWLDEEYEASDVEIEELHFFSDIVLAVAGEQKEIEHVENPRLKKWEDPGRPVPSMAKGSTLQECFLRKCDEMGKSTALADDIVGVLNWKEFKTAVLLFASVIKNYPGRHIAVLLPSSVLANIITLAVLLAGKIPVMLNWTVGRRNLEHTKGVSGYEVILTSSAFLDKIDNVEFGALEENLVFVEDIKSEKISIGEKLCALLKAEKSADALLEELELNHISPDEPCVVLFTSGSEAAPKGVPLTHENILSNIQGAFRVLEYESDSSLFAFLPAFHSFGFTITMMMPMLSGIKTAYHANPNEGRRIARGCHQHGATFVCGTPTFITNVFRASKDGQLDSLRYIIVGAEKMPTALKESVSGLPNAEIFEGYGITECSPVISMNCPGRDASGVGYPMPDVEIHIVDLDSHKRLEQGERGLILVRGPSIFHGYLGDIKDPFEEIDGQQWYNTGDLGYLCKDGSLVLAGRLKRFVKIGGEMISLPAIEEVLAQKWPASEDGPVLAVHAQEEEGKRPELCLFSAVDISLEDANDAMAAGGLSNLSKLKQFVKLDELPKLGTGKIDYQSLKKLMK